MTFWDGLGKVSLKAAEIFTLYAVIAAVWILRWRHVQVL